jgi:hypothetical protein
MRGQLARIARDGRHAVAAIESFSQERAADVTGGAQQDDLHDLVPFADCLAATAP